MVVDDNETTRTLMGLLLNKRNYWVKTCGSALEAFQAMQEGTLPDVLVTDYYLPDGSGVELMKAVRKMPGGDHVRMLVCTAATTQVMEKYREDFAVLNAGVIFKPFEPDNCMEAIDRAAFPDTAGRPIHLRHPIGDSGIFARLKANSG